VNQAASDSRIAHELGHYVLPSHRTLERICESTDVESWGKGVPGEEIEANRFASELIMPADQIAPLISRETATITLAKQISKKYESSLTAAAVKCVDLTDEQCAFVVSDGAVIQWWRGNSRFLHYIKGKGSPVSIESLASDLFAGAAVREKDGAVPAHAWLAGNTKGKVWEDSILLPFYNRVLTIVTVRPGDIK
jgi:hypothetical protein